MRAVRFNPSGRIDSGPCPKRNEIIDAAKIAQTPHRTRTPIPAPFVSISTRIRTVNGRLTQRGSGINPYVVATQS